jgi:hypothetical protein
MGLFTTPHDDVRIITGKQWLETTQDDNWSFSYAYNKHTGNEQVAMCADLDTLQRHADASGKSHVYIIRRDRGWFSIGDKKFPSKVTRYECKI